MENIELGEVIAVDGLPDWVDPDEVIMGKWATIWYSGGFTWAHCYADPEAITAIRLRSDHPYYLATAKGFTYWPGGESAPDADEVLFRDGSTSQNTGWIWTHSDHHRDIIGYRRKAEPVTTITLSPITRAEAYEDGLDITTLERLGLLKEETLLERFEREYGGLDNNQRDIVAAYQEWVASI